MRLTHNYLLILCLFASLISYSQPPRIASSLHAELNNVLNDMGNGFLNLRGEVISIQPQSMDYRSVHQLRGSLECMVSVHSDEQKEIYSWQATMIRTEDFQKAVTKFKSLYNSIKGLRFNPGSGVLTFTADYDDPDQSIGFASIVFQDDPEPVSRLRIELLLEYDMLEWYVKILIYEREKEDVDR